MSREILRLITAKSVLGEAGVPELKPGETYVPLFRVWGMANAVKLVKGTYGDGFKLIGHFEACLLSTGALSTSPMLILPPPMNDVIAAEIEARPPGAGGLSFAFEVGIKPGTPRPGKSRQAYEWVTKNLVEQTDADPLAALRDSVARLPAPEVESGKGKSASK